MSENVVQKKMFFSVKRLLQILTFICLIFVFCPSFLVSCSGQKVEVSVLTTVKGIESYGIQIVEPQPIMLIFFIIPIISLIVLFLKNITDKKCSMINLFFAVVDVIIWFIFRTIVKKYAEENYCIFDTKIWYVINIVFLLQIIIIYFFVINGKLKMETDFLTLVEKINKSKIISQLPSTMNQVTNKVANFTEEAANNIASKYSNESKIEDYINSDCMIACSNCNEDNSYNAKFCKKCGKPLADEKNALYEKLYNEMNVSLKQTSSVSNLKNVFQKVFQKIKNTNKKVLFGIICAFASLLILICIFSNASKTINLNKYIYIETEGYDGYGSASVYIDWDAIAEKYDSKISYTSKAKMKYGRNIGLLSPSDIVKDMVSIKLDKNTNLSNGDIINYSWNVDSNYSKYIKCKLKFKNDDFKVSDLSKISSFDPFGDLSVSFTGIAPDGRIEINYEGNDFSNYDFEIDKNKGLKNGDSVTISVSVDDMSSYAYNHGKIPERLSNTYIVSGLQEYVGSFNTLSKDFIAKVKDETQDTIYAYCASSYSSSSKLTNLSYSGYIFMNTKEETNYLNPNNKLYILYSGDVSNSEGKFRTSKVYFPIRFTNIIIGDEITYEENQGIVGRTYIDGTWNETRGYTNPINCYIDIVDSNQDDYNIECGDGFEIFKEYQPLTQLRDIDKEYKQSLLNESRDYIESYVVKNYDEGSCISELVFMGEYFLVAKSQGYNFSKNNKYFSIYSAKITNSKGRFEDTVVYFPVEYDGIVKLPTDEYIVSQMVGICGEFRTLMTEISLNSKGYLDGNEMFTKLVTANRDNYLYEVAGDIKSFGE